MNGMRGQSFEPVWVKGHSSIPFHRSIPPFYSTIPFHRFQTAECFLFCQLYQTPRPLSIGTETRSGSETRYGVGEEKVQARDGVQEGVDYGGSSRQLPAWSLLSTRGDYSNVCHALSCNWGCNLCVSIHLIL